MNASMDPQDVADWLQQHPEFFEQHAGVFATLTVPHPHGGRAIPLAERQMMTLRDKNRALEMRVAELMRFGQENDAIAEKLRAMGVEVPEAIALPPDRARLYPTRPAKADVRLNEPPPGPKRKPRAPSSRRK